MRDLTKEEKALAPYWATHYFIDLDRVFFQNEFICVIAGGGSNDIYEHEHGLDDGDADCIPLDLTLPPISERKFFDGDGIKEVWLGEEIQIIPTSSHGEVNLSRDDIIAIAKSMNVKPSDLE